MVFHDQSRSIEEPLSFLEKELTKILSSVFNVLLPSVEFRKAEPLQYRLSQVADIFCTFELLSLKSQAGIMTHSEKLFFGSIEDMKRNYIKPLRRKHFDKCKKIKNSANYLYL